MVDQGGGLPILSDSTFHMLRCVLAVAHADNVVKDSEREFLRTLVAHIRRHNAITDEQLAQLEGDVLNPKNIDELLPRITEKNDRADLVLFAGLLAMADGEMHPSEKDILTKIGIYVEAANAAEETIGQPAPKSNFVTRTSLAPVVVSTAHITPVSYTVQFIQQTQTIVAQESFTDKLATSGVIPKTAMPAVADAFAEKGVFVDGSHTAELLKEMPRMGYAAARSLVEGERLLGVARIHWMYHVQTVLMVAAMLGTGYLIRLPAHRLGDQLLAQLMQSDYSGHERLATKLMKVLAHPMLQWGPLILMLVAALALSAYRLLAARNHCALITDMRFIYTKGIFKVNTLKIDISKLDKIEVDQSFIGYALDYGAITITTQSMSGKGADEYGADGLRLHPMLADPHGFSSIIDRVKRLWRTGALKNWSVP